ncbi:hypothetical protein [Leptolyngbya sp. Cla-17]|uniref:hypothetical protein n=1 Tax=Leptolyngbya sp. Cla-17 TaxID=2803751 RepID=UPI001934A181|nr:hypothetical protein [Leptolyngbya sp. Cla-17]
MKQSSPGSKVKSKSKERHVDAPKLESLEQINLNAAGLDVGASEIYACVPEGRCQSSVRVFSSFTADLNALTAGSMYLPSSKQWSFTTSTPRSYKPVMLKLSSNSLGSRRALILSRSLYPLQLVPVRFVQKTIPQRTYAQHFTKWLELT